MIEFTISISENKTAITIYQVISLVPTILFIMVLDSDQNLVGQILSIAGLALAPFCTLLGRHYSRSLYFAQLLYIFSSIYGSTTNRSFSVNFDYSWLSFMPKFTSLYCNNQDFSCTYGYLVSPGLAWFAGAIGLFLIMKFAGCCSKKGAKFLSVYNFYKGFYLWFMPPLVYYATLTVITSYQKDNTNTTSFKTAVIVLGLAIAVPVIELIAYKTAQREEENNWRKWIQFWCKIFVQTAMVLVAISEQISSASVAKYLINVPLGLYAIMYIIKYKFTSKCLERFVVILQEAAIIAVYNIFVINYQNITKYNLDFYALCGVILFQILTLLPKFVRCCRGSSDDEDASVNPQKEQRGFDRVKKNNSFLQGDIINSNQELNQSSPRRGGNSPPRGNPAPLRANPPPARRR